MGADQLIYIRTDGNKKIASGHLVRCLSIAENCLNLGMSVCFLLSDEESRKLFDSFLTENFRKNPLLTVQVLETAVYDDLEAELPEVISLLGNSSVQQPVLLLDSYFVTEKYLTAVRSAAKLAYLDDLQLFDYPVDLLINYDVIPADTLPAYEQAYQKAGRKLLGAAYTPLRSQFKNKAITVKEKVTDILVTTGGSDPYHFCVEFLQKFMEKFCPSFSQSLLPETMQTSEAPSTPLAFAHTNSIPVILHIVIGKLNQDKEQLYALADQYDFIKLHENVTDMAGLMGQCDLAVSAAGTTLYELCALGVPAVSYTMADNQLVAAKAFADTGAISWAGDIRTEKAPMMNRIFYFLISASFQNRYDAHHAMRKLVDGNGAFRIAAELSLL